MVNHVRKDNKMLDPDLSMNRHIIDTSTMGGGFFNRGKGVGGKKGKVIMLDQSKLPLDVVFIDCTNYRIIAEGIKNSG